MPSPIDETSFQTLTNQATVCQRLGALINGYNAMFEFFEWFLNDQNEISDAALEGMADRMTPIGTILLWSSDILPSDKWLVCNGQHYAKSEYLTLSGRLGSKFGLVEGDTSSSRFRVPDLTDRFPVGAGLAYGIGATGGLDAVTLKITEMPEHTHGLDLPANNSVEGTGDNGKINIDPDVSPNNSSVASYTTNPTGGDAAHENRPPYIGLRFIIKAK